MTAPQTPVAAVPAGVLAATGHNEEGRAGVAGKPAPARPGGGGSDGVLSAGQRAIAAAMTEVELEGHISRLCAGLGILRFHVPDSRGMARGLPDDLLIGDRGILFRECKTERGKLRPEQVKVGEALIRHGQNYAVWRPSSLVSGRIQAELVAISGMAVRSA